MGYYIQQQDQRFAIKQDIFENVIQAIKGMTDVNDNDWRFAWVDTDKVLNAKDIKSIFSAWRWDVEFDNNGDINHIQFIGEKLGDDEYFFSMIAPYVAPESFIEMRGDDGNLWRWIFKNGTYINKKAVITWD